VVCLYCAKNKTKQNKNKTKQGPKLELGCLHVLEQALIKTRFLRSDDRKESKKPTAFAIFAKRSIYCTWSKSLGSKAQPEFFLDMGLVSVNGQDLIAVSENKPNSWLHQGDGMQIGWLIHLPCHRATSPFVPFFALLSFQKVQKFVALLINSIF
jgi:hypothetical protein